MIILAIAGTVAATVLALDTGARAGGDPARGKRAFLKCVTCHSAQPNVHKAGPSLAGIWGRNAGTAEGFSRYSDALLSSGIVWEEETLHRWLLDPEAFLPGTSMKMRGITSAEERANIIAYLELLASGSPSARAPSPD